VVALLVALAASPARAQDVEMLAHVMRRPLPAAYWARVRRDPHAFEWPHTQRLVIPPRSGVLSVLVIPALFADTPTPTAPATTPAELQRVLFDGPSDDGSVAEAYREISGGRLAVRARVLPWVRTSVTLQQAMGASQGFGDDARLGDFLRDALLGADTLADFGAFDDDGPDGVPNSGDDNGIVDAVIVLYAERALPCGGAGPWPQLSGYGAWFPDTPVFRSRATSARGGQVGVSGFIMASATACVGDGPPTPAIIAHELGHVLGLPDLYDAAGGLDAASRRWVVGCWDLMSAGAWGCGDGTAPPHAVRPTHYGAWSKERMGWSRETLVGTVRDQEFVLHAANLTSEALVVPISPTERFLLEYRERAGYDAELAASGVVVWHVDDGVTGDSVVAGQPLYQVMLEEADANRALLRTAAEGGNRGEAGDVFGVPNARRFSAATAPAARAHDGRPTTFTIHDVVLDPATHTARVRLTTDPTPLIAASPPLAWPALASDARALRVTGGAPPYAVSLTGRLPDGLTVTAAADDLLVRGTPTEAGTFTPTLAVRDALGTSASRQLTLTVTAPAIALARLLAPLLRDGAPPLADAERAYLDRAGNANGAYDVGDLRAYLLANPAAALSAITAPRAPTPPACAAGTGGTGSTSGPAGCRRLTTPTSAGRAADSPSRPSRTTG